MLTGCMPPQTTGITDEDINLIQLSPPTDGQTTAVIKTNIGDITMVLYEEQAPKTVEHFKKLITEKFYDNQVIYTNEGVNSFVTGMNSEDEMQRGKIVTENGKPLDCEITPSLWHFSGAVSVLGYEKSPISKKMLSDSRFFIIGDVDATTEVVTQMEEYGYPQKVVDAYKEHGGMPQYTGYYTIFGQVVDGMDLVNTISAYKSQEEAAPISEVTIQTIELSQYSKTA